LTSTSHEIHEAIFRFQPFQRRTHGLLDNRGCLDTRGHADAAVKALKAGGFANADISIFDDDRLAGGKKAIAADVKEAGLWHRLFGVDIHEHEADVYHQTVERDGVVSARVLDSEVAHASAILDLRRARCA
jgi:hypothetical protein